MANATYKFVLVKAKQLKIILIKGSNYGLVILGISFFRRTNYNLQVFRDDARLNADM